MLAILNTSDDTSWTLQDNFAPAAKITVTMAAVEAMAFALGALSLVTSAPHGSHWLLDTTP